MSFFSKLALTVGTAASLAAAATPAMARPYGGYGGFGGYRHHDNTGAVLAGALLLGGIVAIAASSNHHDHDRYREGYDGGRPYHHGGYAPGPYREYRQSYEGGYDRPADYSDGYGERRHCEHDGD